MNSEGDRLITEFRSKPAAELDAIFTAPGTAVLPQPGNYTGTWLRRIENAGTYKTV